MLKLILIILAVLTFFYIFSELAELEHDLKLRLSEHEWVKVALFLLVPVICGIIVSRDNIIKLFY